MLFSGVRRGTLATLAGIHARSVTPRVLSAAGRHRMMSDKAPKIIYTLTDEAPALATFSLLPIFRRFISPAGIKVETSDISVASRILTQFNDILPKSQHEPDNLAALGEVCDRMRKCVCLCACVRAYILPCLSMAGGGGSPSRAF